MKKPLLKRVRVTVTAQDIRRARADRSRCPIDRAASRRLGRKADTGFSLVQVGGALYSLPPEAMEFIGAFDFGALDAAKPFIFTMVRK